jgi:Restriction endonuclease
VTAGPGQKAASRGRRSGGSDHGPPENCNGLRSPGQPSLGCRALARLWRRESGGRRPRRCLWAVQAKAYASFYAIKKADVDSFLRRRGSSAPRLQPPAALVPAADRDDRS